MFEKSSAANYLQPNRYAVVTNLNRDLKKDNESFKLGYYSTKKKPL
jgi:hypothetical protein